MPYSDLRLAAAIGSRMLAGAVLLGCLTLIGCGDEPQPAQARPTHGSVPAFTTSAPEGPAFEQEAQPARPAPHEPPSQSPAAVESAPAAPSASPSPGFADLGIPVRIPRLMGAVIGPAPGGKKECVYLNLSSSGGRLTLAALDPDTGQVQAFEAPFGAISWGFCLGPDKKIYLAECGKATLFCFDPLAPEKGIQSLGTLCATESFVWELVPGPDGLIYAGTYPNAMLIAYDPKQGTMNAIGRMDPEQWYLHSLAFDADGLLYGGIGFGRAEAFVYDPQTGKHHALLPPGLRDKNVIASVSKGGSGAVYVHCGAAHFRAEKGVLTPIAKLPEDPPPPLKFNDGRTLELHAGPGARLGYTVVAADGARQPEAFATLPDAATSVFYTAVGPDGAIYGSSAVPCELFRCDPATGKTVDLGVPVDVDGELYGIVSCDQRLYLFAYSLGRAAVYDPAKPFHFNPAVTGNPHPIEPLGDDLSRPRAAALGDAHQIYVGGVAGYGRRGGGLVELDTSTDKIVLRQNSPVPDQSIACLTYDPKTQWLWGGTNVHGGEGIAPNAKAAALFAWSAVTHQKVRQFDLTADDQLVSALVQVNRRLFLTCRPSGKLLVFDLDTETFVHSATLAAGEVLDLSLGLRARDGKLYGLTAHSIFRIDPTTFAEESVATFPRTLTCGFALTDDAIYCGEDAHLIRYRFP